MDAAMQRLIEEDAWDERAFRRAFRHAQHALKEAAKEQGVSKGDLATTLQVVILRSSKVQAAMVGDGAVIVAAVEDDVTIPMVLLAPQEGEYANEVVPMTSGWWKRSFRYAERTDAPWAMTFTDGLTRLLMQRDGSDWVPFTSFFDAFMPRMAAAGDDTEGEGGTDRLVQDFLDADHVDASWDDDKCMVVAWRDDVV